jgi:hypothetical protein
VVIFPCLGIEICVFLHDGTVLRLLLLDCCLLILILAVLLDAYIPLDPQVLVVW